MRPIKLFFPTMNSIFAKNQLKSSMRFPLPILLLLAMFAFCKLPGKKETLQPTPFTVKTKPDTKMPALTTPGDYSAAWQEIDSLEQSGLPKSALEKTEALYTRAKNDNNASQVLKTLLYKGKFLTFLEEDGIVKAMELYEAEIKTLHQPEKSVLQSILGELYATYLQNQGWRINNRTEITNSVPSDLKTWSTADFEQRALDLYQASLEAESALRGAPVNYIKDIIEPGLHDTVDVPLRATLFDFLAYRALQHFQNERSYLNEPAFKFELNQEVAFAPAKEFLQAKFESKDSSSGKWMAIRLFQRLMSNQNANPSTLIDADLARLNFVRNNSTLEDAPTRYEQALEVLHKQYYDHPSDAEIVWNLANYLFAKEKDKTGPKLYRKSAYTLCEDAIRRHPNTYGAKNCAALIALIKSKNLSIYTEATYLPEKSILFHASFQNLSKLYVKLVQVPAFEPWNENTPYDQILPLLNGKPIVQQKTWDVTDPGDYYGHETELKLNPCSVGHYVVMTSDNPDFDAKKGYVYWAPFFVSRLTAVHYIEQNRNTYALLDRQSGAAIPGVKASFYRTNYNYNRNQYERISLGSQTSDARGIIQKETSEQENGEVWFSLGKDSLPGDNFYTTYHRTADSKPVVQFFTDRSIYRPGQTVYFKGVLYQRDLKYQPSIVAGKNLEVQFYDVNGQVKGNLKLKSNDFGTFNGAFTAPSTGLTGRMNIRVTDVDGIGWINVEEYKRPKFEVTMLPVEASYRLNEKIVAKGEAKAYAGSNIDGALVKYRVQRQARFPFWDYGWGKSYYPWNTNSMEIAQGETHTDADGHFEIPFTAIPDLSIAPKEQPVFDYTVSVDITDINGETRSTSSSISVGYVAYEVNLGISNNTVLDSLKKVQITVQNRSGKVQPAQGTIRLQRLDEPGKFFIDRYWDKPDVWTLNEADFKKDFPEYSWKEEGNPETWDKEGPAIEIAFNTANNTVVNLNNGQLKAGYYQLLLQTKDNYGSAIEIKKLIRVWDAKKPVSQFTKPDAILDQTSYQPGQAAQLLFGSKYEQLNVFYAQEVNAKLQDPKVINIKGAENVRFDLTEADRGGKILHWYAVRDNRIYGGSPITIPVPWKNKLLNITYESFRDKLSPGQQEEWRIKISGPDKEQVAAELAATMYDASLDQFLPHGWYPIGFYDHSPEVFSQGGIGFGVSNADMRFEGTASGEVFEQRIYKSLNWFNFPLYGGYGRGDYGAPGGAPVMAMQKSAAPRMAKDEESVEKMANAPEEPANFEAYSTDSVVTFDPEGVSNTGKPNNPPPPPAAIRNNLNETVFFFPELHTDAEGNVILKFKMNEALTRWKLLLYAHTKDLKEAISEKSVLTQKELMVLANPPRFLRAGDTFEFSAKVSNLSKEALDGKATLALLDATTLKPLEAQFGLDNNRSVPFQMAPGASAPLRWTLKVPADFTGAVTWQVFADGKQFRDGEESTIPVVTNRMLVTETLPITVRGGQTKKFSFDNLKRKNNGTLVSQRFSLEFTSNPAWYVVQALPYLMEYPHQCSEQVFSRFYANTLASSVTEKLPNIRRVFERWKGTDALKSNLAKNQELKYALLEETPWVMEAQSEAQQKQNIALLMDLNRMADEKESALNILRDRQTSSGGWPWFSGGRESWYITQYIVEGLGHLHHLGAIDLQKEATASQMLDRALGFCDNELEKQYKEIEKAVKEGKAKWEDDHLGSMEIHYLYARSFFPSDRINKIQAYYLEQAQKYWLGKGLYQEGLIALALHRNGRKEAAQKIVNSLRERAQQKEELGMYWSFDWGYYWYNLPIETQALMVEVFDEVASDTKAVEELRIWLLKNKQTNRWESTKATASAAYALLLHGDNWLNNTAPVAIQVGGRNLKPAEIEPGTGYFKQSWDGKEVQPSWGDIQVVNTNSNIVWGAAYWQYFEDLDKIESFKKTPLTIVKQLFKEENSPTGPKLTALSDNNEIKVGDKLKVRIEIRVDRPMEYVHLKDMRAAGFEPLNVLSGYHWQDGLGYYESTKDLATNFFFDYLPRGTYVFEYPMVASNRGDMSNGVTTIQCMYAPEFTSHSQGIRVKVK
jgi:uncharacterized protein YfaS (alpha-2-macroglobulin family)